MNKLIIISILGCFVLAGTFTYFYYSQEEVEPDDTLYIKNIQTEDMPVEENPIQNYDRIIEIDYDNKKEDCVITKCTSAGCVC